jgi:hypothetical protein
LDLLNVLLERAEIRLRPGKVARAQILGQLRKCLVDRALRGALRGCLRSGGSARLTAGKQLLKSGEVALDLRQIAGLKILTDLLKFLLNLFEFVLNVRGTKSGEKVAS